MKIVCSNKSLARALKTVFEKDDFVKECEVHPKEAGSLAFLKLTNQYGISEKVIIETNADKIEIFKKQVDRRWDWVYEACKILPEQPISLSVSENMVEIKLQY